MQIMEGIVQWNIAELSYHFQLGLEMVCDVDFSPLDARIVVVTGKEHLGWWQIDTENRVIQLYRKPEYQVISHYNELQKQVIIHAKKVKSCNNCTCPLFTTVLLDLHIHSRERCH